MALCAGAQDPKEKSDLVTVSRKPAVHGQVTGERLPLFSVPVAGQLLHTIVTKPKGASILKQAKNHLVLCSEIRQEAGY